MADKKDDKTPNREKCMFGVKCYRRNPVHLREYFHPHLEDLSSSNPPENVSQTVVDQWKILKSLGLLKQDKPPSSNTDKEVEPPPAKKVRKENSSDEPNKNLEEKKHSLVKKLDDAEPFNLFLTKVKGVSSTHNDSHSLFLTDLLHSCHGNLRSTVQINFLVDYEWLKMCYEATGNEKIPLLILYGEENADLNSNSLPQNVKALRIRSPYPYGTHHTKLMILNYIDGSIRIVVSTANLVPSDWENRTQGLWVSPKCPGNDPRDSVTGFKTSLLRYLASYHVSQLHPYIESIKEANFSSINAFFIASSPGSFEGSSLCHYGHMAAGSILRKHMKQVRWPLIMQCSSIGSLGQTPNAWCTGELADSLGPGNSEVKVVYPSKKNVFQSLDGILGGHRKLNLSSTLLSRFLLRSCSKI